MITKFGENYNFLFYENKKNSIIKFSDSDQCQLSSGKSNGKTNKIYVFHEELQPP